MALDRSITRMVSNCVMMKALHSSTGEFEEMHVISILLGKSPTNNRYAWPDVHLDYMSTRMFDHGQRAFGTFIRTFKWARSNRENPGCRFPSIEFPAHEESC